MTHAVLPTFATMVDDDRGRVGDKAWQLARLARAGLPVPAGFCIPGDAIPADCVQVSDLPGWLTNAIRDAYRRLGSPPVAVRSSASDEDQAGSSAAGLYSSFLNVRGEAALLVAVFACWQARLQARAVLARADRQPPSMAILVQTQVDAEAAGVLFTTDPLNGTGDHIVINAVLGLGEPLASGRVSGDVFHVDRDGELLEQRISHKELMLTAGGQRPVPLGRCRRPALTPPQIRQLARLAAAVKGHFGGSPGAGLDIEFAVRDGAALLLQARPVPPARTDSRLLDEYLDGERQRVAAEADRLRRAGRVVGSDVIWSAGNIRELLPTPSRFSFALFCRIFAGRSGAIVRGRRRLGYRLAADAGEDLFALIGGQAYFNLEIDAGTYDAGMPVPVEALIAAVSAQPAAANYPELGLYPQLLATCPGADAATARFRTQMLAHAAHYERRFRRLLPRLESLRRRVRPSPAEAGFDALQAEFAAGLERARQIGLRFVIAARLGFYFADSLQRRLHAEFPARAELAHTVLLQGLPGSRISEQSLDLERLANGLLGADQYLADYGHMAGNELELLLPRLAETPDSLARQVAELRASERSPATEFARQARRRRRAEAALVRRLHRRPEAAAVLAADLKAAQTFLPLRETLKYYLAAEIAGLRSLLTAMAERLGWPEDSLFHLDVDEVVALTPTSAAALGPRIAMRRLEREVARRVARAAPLPPVVFASRLDELGSVATPGQDGGCFDATPIAPGVAEGTVRRLLLDEDELSVGLPATVAAFSGGEIIVAASANLGLAPLFRVAAGVIVEVGGVLAHSACQAREAGIPALVLPAATRLLRDGDRVRIDAGRGTVTLLERTRGPRGSW